MPAGGEGGGGGRSHRFHSPKHHSAACNHRFCNCNHHSRPRHRHFCTADRHPAPGSDGFRPKKRRRKGAAC